MDNPNEFSTKFNNKSIKSRTPEYSRNYYQLNKEKFKTYYATYKLKKEQEKYLPPQSKPVKVKKTKRELLKINFERRQIKLDKKIEQFKAYLKSKGYPISDNKVE